MKNMLAVENFNLIFTHSHKIRAIQNGDDWDASKLMSMDCIKIN